MSTFEIPPAVEKKDAPLNSDDLESQKKACFEAIEKINDSCGSAVVILAAKPHEELVKELEEKGYRVNYTLDYDSAKKENKVLCKLRIINPNIKDAGTDLMSSIEENLKKIGFNKASIDTEEKFKQLFNNLMMF